MVSSAQRIFNGIGVVLTLACLAAVLAGNTGLGWRLEHAPLPLSWGLAAAALFAFLLTEICDSEGSLTKEGEDPRSQLSSEWETVELHR
jgi:hypothetical protein